jgi:hypothetical protein
LGSFGKLKFEFLRKFGRSLKSIENFGFLIIFVKSSQKAIFHESIQQISYKSSD